MLDLGCNVGTDIIYAAKHGWVADGCDIDSDAIHRANQLFRLNHVTNIAAYHMRIQDCLEETTYEYDFVTCIDVLSFIPPDQITSVLRGIGRVTKPGGTIVLRVFTTREGVVTKRPDRTFFRRGRLAYAFASWKVIRDEFGVNQDPGHVGRPTPHQHHVEVFVAKKP